MSDGYLCLCDAGRIGDGFKTDIGGGGCSEQCNLFSVDCGNVDFTITFNTDCVSDFYKYLDWSLFYIGEEDDACRLVEDNTGTAVTISYADCQTQLATTADDIVYSNVINYSPSNGFNFFTEFDIKCAVSKVVNTQLINVEVVNDVSLVGDLTDDFALVDYAALIVTNTPDGHASEYRLGEQITLSLDFTRLDHAFDYRLNRCYATNTDDGSSFYILGDEVFLLSTFE